MNQVDHLCIPDVPFEEDDRVRCLVCGNVIENDDRPPQPVAYRPRWSSNLPPDYEGCDT